MVVHSWRRVSMRRVSVRSGHSTRLFPVPDDLTSLLRHAALDFGRDPDSLVLVTASTGAVVTDVCLLRDDESLVLRPLEPSPSDWLTLNVGGRLFTTTRSTLTSLAPDSMLARMFAADPHSLPPAACDATGAFLIDRSPQYFDPILGYLRHGQLILDPGLSVQGVLTEARFYGLQDLVTQLEQMLDSELEQQRRRDSSLTRSQVVAALIGTTCTSELRFQGVNLVAADLSKLDLRHINFKYAALRGANLSCANLSHACLERADLSRANLDGAIMFGVRMVCANLEGSSLRGINCEDPYDDKTTMEGVNLKVRASDIDIEESTWMQPWI